MKVLHSSLDRPASLIEMMSTGGTQRLFEPTPVLIILSRNANVKDTENSMGSVLQRLAMRRASFRQVHLSVLESKGLKFLQILGLAVEPSGGACYLL